MTVDAKIAAALSDLSYAETYATSELPSGWAENISLGRAFDKNGGAVALNSPDAVNRIRVFYSDDGEQMIAFKGSDNIPNFVSDFDSAGASTYIQVHSELAGIVSILKQSNNSIYVTGHSLGGGMAQCAALEWGLNGFGQNSLPIASGTWSLIAAAHGVSVNNIDSLVDGYRLTNRFVETNVESDPATLLFSTTLQGSYLDESPTTIVNSSVRQGNSISSALLFSGNPILQAVGFGLGAYYRYKAHSIEAFRSLLGDYDTDEYGELIPRGSVEVIELVNDIDFMSTFDSVESLKLTESILNSAGSNDPVLLEFDGFSLSQVNDVNSSLFNWSYGDFSLNSSFDFFDDVLSASWTSPGGQSGIITLTKAGSSLDIVLEGSFSDASGHDIYIYDKKILDDLNDQLSGILKLKIEIDEANRKTIIDGAAAVGSAFGSTIGSMFAAKKDFNTVESIAATSFLSIIGGNLAKSIASFGVGQSANITDALKASFHDFPGQLQGAAIGAISSLLVGEFVSAIGLNGVAGQVVTIGGSTIVTSYATAVINSGGNFVAAAQNFSVDWSSLSMAFATYIGTRLGQQVYQPKTTEGQIGSSVGAAAGAYIGMQYGSLFGPVGAFVGYIVGAVVGDLIGNQKTPRSWADVIYDANTNQFVVTNARRKEGGSIDAARGLAQSAADIFNSLTQAIGGDVINSAGMVLTLGTRNAKYTVSGSAVPSAPRSKDAGAIMRLGVFNTLQTMQIAGGDVYLKRAFYNGVNSLASTAYDNQNAFQILSGNLVVAADFSRYAADPSVINALIAAEPDSAFTAGWIITLQRAEELGLNKRYVSDEFGGWEYRLREGGKNRIDTTMSGTQFLYPQAINTTLSYNGTTKERVVSLNYYDVLNNTTFVKKELKKLADGIAPGSKKTLQFTNQAQLDADLQSVRTAAVINGNDNANDVIKAGDLGNDVFGGDGNDTIYGGVMSDWIFGGNDSDTLYSMSATPGDTRNDNNNYLNGGAGNDILIGGDGSDWLAGGTENDVLYANGGDDILDGGAGDDSLYGGAGNDTYLVNRGDGLTYIEDREEYFSTKDRAYFNGLSGEKVWVGNIVGGTLGGGTDTLELGVNSAGKVIQISDVSIKLQGDDLIISIDEDANAPGADTITIKNWKTDFGRVEKLRFATGDEIELGAFRSFILGTAGDDILNGTNGRDFIYGGAGNDTIHALAGDDVAIGGLGNDIVSGDNDNDVVVGSEGNDNLFGGLGNDIVSGDNGDDVLRGDAGVDILTGGAGNDWIDGGADNDVVRFGRGDGHDTLIDQAPFTADVAWDLNTFNFASNYDFYDGNGKTGIYIYGTSEFKYNVWYDAVAGKIYYGTSGGAPATPSNNDTLEFRIGVAPADIRVKQSGSDLIIALESPADAETAFANLSDSITIKDWYTNKSIENFAFYTYANSLSGSGNSVTAFNFIGGDGLANADDILNGSNAQDWITGGVGNDTILGYDGRDVLNGNGGVDTLIGGGGGDVLIGGAGFDYVSYQNAGPGIVASLFNGSGTGGEAAGDEFDGVEGLIGSAYADVLIGNDGANELRGNGASNGTDTLQGLGGDDVYIYNEGDGEVVIDEGVNGSGNDTIQFGPTIGLSKIGAKIDKNDLVILINDIEAQKIIIRNWWVSQANNVENLLFANGMNIKISSMIDWLQIQSINAMEAMYGAGYGTNSADFLHGVFAAGLEGDDFISGTNGVDTLVGGNGNDILDGGAGVDRIIGGAGIDTVSYFGQASGVIATLSETQADILISIENIDGTAYADTLTGDAQSNQLTGNDGVDILRGMDGADTLLGQVGADTLYGGNGEDILSGGDNDDTLYGDDGADALSGDAGNDYLDGGAGYDNLAGGTGDDHLLGQAGEDILDGGAGNDTLSGGADDDALFGGDGNDTLYGEAGNDLLINSAGNDYLDGGAGNDTYRITRTHSTTTIAKEQANNDTRDTVELLDNITIDQLWFTRDTTTNDLRIRVLEETAETPQTQIVLKGWFDADSGIERIDTIGSRLNRDQVQALVTAMAGQAVPAIASGVSTTLQTTIHNTWVEKDTIAADPVSDITLRTAGAFAIREDATIGTVVGKVDAFSSSHQGSAYQYSLVSAAQDQFVIDPNTGIITTARNVFDAEVAAQQVITVRVVDTVSPELSYEQNIAVNINKLNKKPIIESNIFSIYEYNFSKDGNTPWNQDMGEQATYNGKYVGHITAYDPEGSNLKYQIVSDNTYDAFTLNENGDLYVRDAGWLDYEFRQKWSFKVRAIDSNGLASEEATINVVLKNIEKEGAKVLSLKGRTLTFNPLYQSSYPSTYSFDGNQNAVLDISNNSEPTREIRFMEFGRYDLDTGIRLRNEPGSEALGRNISILDNLSSSTSTFDVSGLYSVFRNSYNLMEPIARQYMPSGGQTISDGWLQSYSALYGGWKADEYFVIREYRAASLTNGERPSVAIDDHISTDAGKEITISAASLTANDAGTDLQVYSVSNINPNGGIVVFDSYKQTISYTPQAGFVGQDIITYQFSNGSSARVFINVAAPATMGSAKADNFIGTNGIDTYAGLGGNDLLIGNEGNDTLSGNDGDDILLGGASNDQLTGGSGNDILNGGLNGDVLIGGIGDDTYYVDDIGDVITENFNEGIDTVITSIGGTLSVNFENMALTGTSAINATGNASKNLLTGNSANNTLVGFAGSDLLDGGAGADVLIGGADNDTYIIDSGSDVITENENDGVDTVLSAITHKLGNNLENLTLTGTALINGTGNAANNILIGNSARNTLVGDAGADIIDGGDGNDILYGLKAFYYQGVPQFYVTDGAADTLIGGNGNDILYIDELDFFQGGSGFDRVIGNEAQAGLSVILKDREVEQVVGSSYGDILDGRGSAVGVTLFGGMGWDTLYGGANADFIDGGSDLEIDYLLGGKGNDTYIFDINYGPDYLADGDSTIGNVDILKFGSEVSSSQLWFEQSGSDLIVSIIGTDDWITIANWYSGSSFHIEQFKTADGKTLLDSNVANLVNAMASFAPPAAGQTTLPQNYQNSLNSVIAANWS